jgi:hypothetical protein
MSERDLISSERIWPRSSKCNSERGKDVGAMMISVYCTRGQYLYTYVVVCNRSRARARDKGNNERMQKKM